MSKLFPTFWSPTRGAAHTIGRDQDAKLDAAYTPKIEPFSEEQKDGFRFIESFKHATDGVSDETRLRLFGRFCGVDVLLWYQGQNFEVWADLERRFKETWCQVLLPTQALNKALKLKQGENEFLRTYTSKFENLHRFFASIVQPEGVFRMFLDNTRHAIRKHHLEILLIPNLTWSKLLDLATYYDNSEPRDEVIVKQEKEKQYKRKSANQVSGEEGVKKSKNEIKLSKEVKDLREELKRLRAGKTPTGERISREGKKCYRCEQLGHFARECYS